MRGPRVAALRQRLQASGDLDSTVVNADIDYFDEQLEQAVEHFQRRHKLDVDGKVGKDTLREMNIPVTGRIDQIRVNMERLRWVFRNPPKDFLIVDIAGFRAAVVLDGEIVWSSRVQVGQPYRTTPVFQDSMKYIVFNPTWTVPPTIFRKDILPRLKKDPAYLQEKNLRVIDQ